MTNLPQEYYDDIERERYLSKLYSDYADRFGDTLPDAHQLTHPQLAKLSSYVEMALRRGSALTARDFGLEQWAEVEPGKEVI